MDDQADGSGQRVRLQGNWRSAYIHLVLRDFEKLLQKKTGDLTVDLSEISEIDTAGIWLLCRLKKQEEAGGRAVRFEGTNPHIDEMLEMFSEEPAKVEPEQTEKVSLTARIFAPIGKMTYEVWDNFAAAMVERRSSMRSLPRSRVSPRLVVRPSMAPVRLVARLSSVSARLAVRLSIA